MWEFWRLTVGSMKHPNVGREANFTSIPASLRAIVSVVPRGGHDSTSTSQMAFKHEIDAHSITEAKPRVRAETHLHGWAEMIHPFIFVLVRPASVPWHSVSLLWALCTTPAFSDRFRNNQGGYVHLPGGEKFEYLLAEFGVKVPTGELKLDGSPNPSSTWVGGK